MIHIEEDRPQEDPSVALYRGLKKTLFSMPEFNAAMSGLDANGLSPDGIPVFVFTRNTEEPADTQTVLVESTFGIWNPYMKLSVSGIDGFTQTVQIGTPPSTRRVGEPTTSYVKESNGRKHINEVGTPAAAVGGQIVLDRLKAPPKLAGL